MRAALLLALAISTPAHSSDRGAPFLNTEKILSQLNFRPYFSSAAKPKQKLKIAIFDNGFRFANEEIGRSLPQNTIIHRGSVAPPPEEETHGFYMARILWSLLSKNGADNRYEPAELHLYNTFGYTNFQEAVDDAIARRIDIVLYSQTWEYGGNFDGGGFINKLVTKATNAGILWINNAGNFGDTTFNAPVRAVADDWIALPDPNNSVAVRCEQNPSGACNLRAVLSWNEFTDEMEDGTDKDLDLVLTDDTLAIVASSNQKQNKNPPAGAPGYSKYAREIVTAKVTPGLYYLRVKKRSNNFGNGSKLRITASGDFVTMARGDIRESLPTPADNPNTITVGASDSEKSSVSFRLNKPEISAPSLVSVTSSEQFKGSSNSAAMVAAGSAVLLSLDPKLSRRQLLDLFSGRASRSSGGLSLNDLVFSFTGAGCFTPVQNVNQLPDYIANTLTHGGTLVNTTAGWKVFFPFDPLELFPGVSRRAYNDILVHGANGPGLYHRSTLLTLPPNVIELVQTPKNQNICGERGVTNDRIKLGSIFRMPNF